MATAKRTVALAVIRIVRSCRPWAVAAARRRPALVAALVCMALPALPALTGVANAVELSAPVRVGSAGSPGAWAQRLDPLGGGGVAVAFGGSVVFRRADGSVERTVALPAGGASVTTRDGTTFVVGGTTVQVVDRGGRVVARWQLSGREGPSPVIWAGPGDDGTLVVQTAAGIAEVGRTRFLRFDREGRRLAEFQGPLGRPLEAGRFRAVARLGGFDGYRDGVLHGWTGLTCEFECPARGVQAGVFDGSVPPVALREDGTALAASLSGVSLFDASGVLRGFCRVRVPGSGISSMATTGRIVWLTTSAGLFRSRLVRHGASCRGPGFRLSEMRVVRVGGVRFVSVRSSRAVPAVVAFQRLRPGVCEREGAPSDCEDALLSLGRRVRLRRGLNTLRLCSPTCPRGRALVQLIAWQRDGDQVATPLVRLRAP
jgi:hypothetical protein